MAEFWHSPDFHAPAAETVRTEKKAPDALAVLNGELSKSGLTAEVPETDEQVIARLHEYADMALKKNGREAPPGGVRIWRVNKETYGVQATQAWVTSFRRPDWETIFNIAQESDSPWVKNYKNPLIKDGFGMITAGYVEKKENGVWTMYELLWTDKNGEYVLGKKIDRQSPEYFKAWQDIVFFANTMNVLYRLKNGMDTPEQGIRNLVEWGSVKLETLELLLKRKLITPEVFSIGIAEMRKVIVSQCADPRFDGFNSEVEMNDDPELAKLWTPIKESDLKKYFEKGYIDADLAKKCFEALRPKMRDVTGKESLK